MLELYYDQYGPCYGLFFITYNSKNTKFQFSKSNNRKIIEFSEKSYFYIFINFYKNIIFMKVRRLRVKVGMMKIKKFSENKPLITNLFKMNRRTLVITFIYGYLIHSGYLTCFECSIPKQLDLKVTN